jgi:hypothetical protein
MIAKTAIQIAFHCRYVQASFSVAGGEVVLTVGRAGAFCGVIKITDPIVRSITWIFMQFGEWVCGKSQVLTTGNKVNAIELEWTPRERVNETKISK